MILLKKFCGVTGVLILIITFAAMSNNPVQAYDEGYQFDNVYSTHGLQTQWMIITKSGTTAGNWAYALSDDEDTTHTSVPLKIAGDITTERSTLSVLNGRNTLSNNNRELDVIFLVLSGNDQEEAENTFVIDFYHSPDDDDDGEAVTPDVSAGTLPYYVVRKTPQNGTLDDSNGTGKEYNLYFQRQSAAEFGSTRSSMIFSQIPTDSYPSTPSQTTYIPFVLANVNGTTASNQPLIFNTILRNNRSTNRGEIVAYDRFTWTVEEAKTQSENTPWVFVPVSSLTWSNNNGEKIPYYLTTKLTNRTGVRYGTYPYDYPTITPHHWEFDLPKLSDYDKLPSKFYLHELSHAAPGLTSVYISNIDMNTVTPEIMQLYPVDPPTPYNPLSLKIRYRPVYGYSVGEAEGTSSSSSTPVPYRITAFTPRAVSSSFYETVAAKMKKKTSSTYDTILVPETAGFFSAGDVTPDYISSGVYCSFAVSKTIPGNYRQTGYEGMLPVVVTFNIPASKLDNWNDMLTQLHNNDGLSIIKTYFRNRYTVGLLSSNNGNNANMFLDLVKRIEEEHSDDWTDYIKVFLDEDREVMTVSFIVLLLDGTSDGTNPATGIVTDETPSEWIQTNKFVAIRDGLANNKWEMTFFIAPANYTISGNQQTNSTDHTNTNPGSSGGGGGGCNFGFIGSLAAMLIIFGASYSHKKAGNF